MTFGSYPPILTPVMFATQLHLLETPSHSPLSRFGFPILILAVGALVKALPFLPTIVEPYIATSCARNWVNSQSLTMPPDQASLVPLLVPPHMPSNTKSVQYDDNCVIKTGKFVFAVLQKNSLRLNLSS